MTATTRSAERTLPLQVDHVGFLLDRLGEDCAPLQFLRELTQNSIEAIARTGEAEGQIIWDAEWSRLELDGPPYKLCLIDTGDGMTGPEMVKYINQLSSSIAQQSLEGNYGVGAKIAAATRNHAGLVYFSWKNGQGSMIHLWRDPEDGTYGLRQFPLGDGRYEHWAPVEAALKPDTISNHGTMVVLLGNDESEDTMKAPADAPSPSRWIAKYLNSRYFKFPDGVEVRAREGWDNPRSDTNRNVLRRVVGQKAYLDDHAESSGEVQLDGAAALWWILKDEDALSQNSGFINSTGHTAALYQDELYEIETARAGAARLQRFGVVFGYRQVVIYVRPEASGQRRISTDTARTSLRLNREPLPWHEWETEFRSKLPAEISELVERVAASSEQSDHGSAIRDRLRTIKDLFKLSRYRPSPAGDVLIDSEGPRRGGHSASSTTDRSGSAKGGGKGGRAGGIYALFVTDGGDTRASKVDADPFPRVVWVSADDGTRAQGMLEDRAASFEPDLNLLQINADFRGFRDMIGYWEAQYGEVKGASSAIEPVVREWFEQALVETVVGLQALEGTSPEWSSADVAKAMSEEGLTAAAMQRYHVINSVKRTLGARLGTLKER
jgi:hypothetical protein